MPGSSRRSALSKVESLAAASVIIVATFGSVYAVYLGCCQGPRSKGTVYVLYAGSLVNTMEASVGPAFQSATGYHYEGEGHGSLQDAQMIISGERSPDVFISVGSGVMAQLAGRAPPLATWWLSFASDQLVIAYGNGSSFAGRLGAASKNRTWWYDVLEEPGFRLGVSDPKLDPKGVYAVLMFKLASIYYENASIAQYPNSTHAHVFAEETMTAELQTGVVDAIIAYKHEAVEQRLSYIVLPSKINFGVPSDSQYYGQVSAYFSGKKSVGAPVTFALTVPAGATNEAGAMAFIGFVVGDPQGRALLERHGLSPIDPPAVGGDASAAPRF